MLPPLVLASTVDMSQRAKNVAHGLRGMARVEEYGTTGQGVAEWRSDDLVPEVVASTPGMIPARLPLQRSKLAAAEDSETD